MSLVNRVEAFLKQISLRSVHYFPCKQREKKITSFRKRPENSDPQKPPEKIKLKDICKQLCITPCYLPFFNTHTSILILPCYILFHLQQHPSVVYYSKQYHDCFQCTRHIWLFLLDSYFCTHMQP